MAAESVDPAYATELLQRQDALQTEARLLTAELDLMTLLRGAGRPKQVDNSVSGLMVWHRLPTYPYEIGGYDVYTPVLDHGVRTPGEFDLYLRDRGLPGR